MSEDSQKRKLSLDAAGPDDDPKRHKSEGSSESVPEADIASLAATDGLSDNDMDDRDDVSDTPTADIGHTIDGPGPYVFYCWEEAISFLVDGTMEDVVYFTLKSASIEAWNHVAHLPKEERYEALEEHVYAVRKWYVDIKDGAVDTPAARLLSQEWDKAYKMANMEVADEKDESLAWWFEVDAQREKPADGSPALEIDLEDEGSWWLTAIRNADVEGRQAMYALVDYLAADS